MPSQPKSLTQSQGTDLAGVVAPSLEPPGAVGGGVIGVGQEAPTQTPPGAETTGITAGAIGGWQDNAHITALWSINQDKNSWIWVANIGWLKLANNSETGIMALTVLASHAKAMGRILSYGTDSSTGMVTQMYVW
jgi:hypothetical protein